MADNAAVRNLFDSLDMMELLENELVTSLIANDNYDRLMNFFEDDRTLTRSQLKSDLSKIKAEDLK